MDAITTHRALIPFCVTLREDATATSPITFECHAEDREHAKKQVENAYPEAALLSIQRSQATPPRTLEQRLKFDHGLSIGDSLVALTHKGASRKALVRIGKRGAVWLLFEPKAGEMYTTWSRITGNNSEAKGAVIVWAARDPSLMEPFRAAPVATVPLLMPESQT